MMVVTGAIIHGIMVPNEKIPHTDPLSATVFLGLGCAEMSLGGLILGVLMLIFLARVVTGKEEL